MFSPNAGVSRQQKANEINPLEVNVDGLVLLCFCPMVLVKSPASTFILLELYLSTISIFLKDYSWIVTKVRVLVSLVDLAFQCIHSSHMIFAAQSTKFCILQSLLLSILRNLTYFGDAWNVTFFLYLRLPFPRIFSHSEISLRYLYPRES